MQKLAVFYTFSNLIVYSNEDHTLVIEITVGSLFSIPLCNVFPHFSDNS